MKKYQYYCIITEYKFDFANNISETPCSNVGPTGTLT